MTRRWGKTIVVTVVLIALVGLPAFGTIIYPNDDASTRGSRGYNASAPFGLLVKGSGDVGWVEFTLGDVEAVEAILSIYNMWGTHNEWEIVVKGAEFDFDETTFTGTDVSTWETVGTFPGVKDAEQFHSLDITDFYNNNLGKTITFQLGREVQPAGDGPIFEDREGTNTGNGMMYGPQISVTPVPEPGSLLLLSVGAFLARRRRSSR